MPVEYRSYSVVVEESGGQVARFVRATSPEEAAYVTLDTFTYPECTERVFVRDLRSDFITLYEVKPLPQHRRYDLVPS